MNKFQKSLLTVITVVCAGVSSASAQIIVADYTLNKGTGYGPNTFGGIAGIPNDSAGDHFFETGYGNGAASYGTASIGGPSTNPTYFSGAGGYYNTANNGDFAHNDFSISIYAEVPTASLGEKGTMLSTNASSAGSIQFGVENGDFVAVLDNGSGNLAGTLLGSFAVNSADTHLTLTDVNGTYVFSDNGVLASSVTPTQAFTGFGSMHIGVGPGANTSYTGYLSDYVITDGVTSLPVSVPEPSTYVMLGLGFAGLVAIRRFRRLNA